MGVRGWQGMGAGAVSGKLGLAVSANGGPGRFLGWGWRKEDSEVFLSRVDAGAGQVEWERRQKVTDVGQWGREWRRDDGPRARGAIWWTVRTEPGVHGQQWEPGTWVGPWSGWAGERTAGLTSDSRGP